nr:hypothetical protein [uncultured Albidiferax sp.]
MQNQAPSAQPTKRFSTATGRRRTKDYRVTPAPAAGESKSERVTRLYQTPGGPLIGWLFDECRRRQSQLGDMAKELGVTYGYINQLRNGIRSTEDVGQAFCEAAAVYLGTPPIVVKLLANQVKLRDFSPRVETEEESIDRAIRQMMDDPKIRQAGFDMQSLDFHSKRMLVLMYGEVTSSDIFGTSELPNILYWLHRSVEIHDAHEFEAKRA